MSPLFEDDAISMHRFEYPTNSRDEMVIKVKQGCVESSHQKLLCFMKSIKRAAKLLTTGTFGDHRQHSPDRIAFLYAGLDDIRLIPLYIESSKIKLDAENKTKKWAAIHSNEPYLFYDTFPGFITSVDGPPATPESLDKVQELLLRDRIPTTIGEVPQACWSYRFDGDPTDDNLFAKLVRGEIVSDESGRTRHMSLF